MPNSIPSIVRHEGLAFCATGKTGRVIATGHAADEYRHDDGRFDRWVWRDRVSGAVAPE